MRHLISLLQNKYIKCNFIKLFYKYKINMKQEKEVFPSIAIDLKIQ